MQDGGPRAVAHPEFCEANNALYSASSSLNGEGTCDMTDRVTYIRIYPRVRAFVVRRRISARRALN
jgi:hypothetical protein